MVTFRRNIGVELSSLPTSSFSSNSAKSIQFIRGSVLESAYSAVCLSGIIAGSVLKYSLGIGFSSSLTLLAGVVLVIIFLIYRATLLVFSHFCVQ